MIARVTSLVLALAFLLLGAREAVSPELSTPDSPVVTAAAPAPGR